MKKPQSAPELHDLLNRRAMDLHVAFSDVRYQNLARESQLSYRHWNKLRRIARDRELDPELAWISVKFGRLSGMRSVPLLATGSTQVIYTVPDRLQHEIMLIDQHLAGQIGTEGPMRMGAEKDRFIASALMEEAIASSMLEGAATTVVAAKEMLRTGRRPRTMGERMVANNYRAMEFIRDNLERRLSPDLLLELHHVLTDDTLDKPDQSGRFRLPSEYVVVTDQRDGELVHEPPPADELPNRIERLCAFANEQTLSDEGGFIHPFIRAALLHFQIGYDHPFCDGNGRTARMIFYWSMLRAGYWLFEFLPISRLIYKSPGKYGQAYLYTETDGFDATYFLVYHARIVQQAREDLREHLVRSQQEIAEARELFKRDQDLNHRQHELLMHAVQHPDTIYTIEGHQRSQRVAYATARSDLLTLVDRKYFSMHKSGSRLEFVAEKKVVALRGRLRRSR
ncbi:MAG: Fic family protein [Phycisphaerae bacterium]|nr:Fic family protein [Phycisphaerae bacterium]